MSFDFTNAEDCSKFIEEIYGADLSRDRGVIHVTSVWAESARSLVTLRIDQNTPRSPTDSFVLGVARARADAIITTGKILRDEPQVNLELQGPGTAPQALAEWRRHRLGKADPPLSAVITSGREIDFAHPLFHGWTRPLILTTHEAAEGLADRAGESIALAGRPEPSIRDAVSYLREARGAETIVVEAGPSTSKELYEPPVRVDELMLSVLREPRIPSSARGSFFFSPQQIGLVFPLAGSSYSVQEETGRWSFHRYRRR